MSEAAVLGPLRSSSSGFAGRARWIAWKSWLMPRLSMATVGDDLDPKALRKGARVDLNARTPGFVHHVEADDKGDAEVRELRGDIEAAGEMSSVDHLHDNLIAGADEVVASDGLIHRHRLQVVDTRRIDNPARRPKAAQPAGRYLDRRAGVIGDHHIGAGQEAEDHALADIGIAYQKHIGAFALFGRLILGAATHRTCSYIGRISP